MGDPLQKYLCLNDFERTARRRLPRPLFGYIAGASETNASLRYNAVDFDAYAFRPRVLRDVSGRSIQTTLLGETYDAPFGIAPMGISALMAYRGDVELADAAQKRRIPMIIEARTMDVAVVPITDIPARFHSAPLYEEDFVIAMRAGHPIAKRMELRRYVEARHLVVSLGGDPQGFVDTMLEQQGLRRRTALTVPNFMLALAIAAESDMLVAIPRQFAAIHAPRFDLVTVDPPLPLPRFELLAVAPRAAMMDAGLNWLIGMLMPAERG